MMGENRMAEDESVWSVWYCTLPSTLPTYYTVPFTCSPPSRVKLRVTHLTH